MSQNDNKKLQGIKYHNYTFRIVRPSILSEYKIDGLEYSVVDFDFKEIDSLLMRGA